MINNPTPITTGIFSGMWITSLQIIFPEGGKKGILQATFLPYDGVHLLATGGKKVFLNDLTTVRSNNTVLDSMLTALVVEVNRQASNTLVPRIIQVNAPNPTSVKVAPAQIIFEDQSVYRIDDCFALCATDATFAGIFSNTMGEIATLAGLTITAPAPTPAP